MLNRRGSSLVELVIACSLTAIVLGTATVSLLQQQRTARRLGTRVAADAQLRGGIGVLSTELAGLVPAMGDLVPGEARDTALQLRVPVASGFACLTEGGQVALHLGEEGAPGAASILSRPRAGDTLWWYPGKGAPWSGRRIADVASQPVRCRLSSDAPPEALGLRVTLVAAESLAADSGTMRVGTPLRATRLVRYVSYRASDGNWYLGVRDWSDTGQRFAPPQPIAGPFARRRGSEWTGFRYFDSDGVELASSASGVDAVRVARIRFTAFDVGTDPGDRGLRASIEVAVERVAPR